MTVGKYYDEIDERKSFYTVCERGDGPPAGHCDVPRPWRSLSYHGTLDEAKAACGDGPRLFVRHEASGSNWRKVAGQWKRISDESGDARKIEQIVRKHSPLGQFPDVMSLAVACFKTGVEAGKRRAGWWS